MDTLILLVLGVLAILATLSAAAYISFAIDFANRRADEREGAAYLAAGRTPHSGAR